MKPIITIIYCPKCGWLLRAAYMAQELLTTFADDLGGVLLKPSETNGQFTIFIGESACFDRKKNGGFIDIKQIKQMVRDQVNPEKFLGHTDRS